MQRIKADKMVALISKKSADKTSYCLKSNFSDLGLTPTVAQPLNSSHAFQISANCKIMLSIASH